jgi:hypothetical protein
VNKQRRADIFPQWIIKHKDVGSQRQAFGKDTNWENCPPAAFIGKQQPNDPCQNEQPDHIEHLLVSFAEQARLFLTTNNSFAYTTEVNAGCYCLLDAKCLIRTPERAQIILITY